MVLRDAAHNPALRDTGEWAVFKLSFRQSTAILGQLERNVGATRHQLRLPTRARLRQAVPDAGPALICDMRGRAVQVAFLCHLDCTPTLPTRRAFCLAPLELSTSCLLGGPDVLDVRTSM